MGKKSVRYLLILLTIVISLRFVESIPAQGETVRTTLKRRYQVWDQRNLVVQPTDPPATPLPTTVPILLSTPLADGTILHIIGGGQSLWVIAEAYQVPFEDLLELNELEPEAIVLPGDELIIAPSYTPTSTPIGEPSATPPPRYTHTPSLGDDQATEVTFLPATSVPTETIQTEPRFRDNVKNPLVVIAAVVISGGSLAAALHFSLRRR